MAHATAPETRPRRARLLPTTLSAFSAALVLCAAAAGVPPAATQPALGPPEVSSLLGDLWRDRDYVYLRIGEKLPDMPGFAPAGATDLTIKVPAMARGRPWPGRWTMLEVEMRPVADEEVAIAFGRRPGEKFRLTKGVWTPARVRVPETSEDLRISIAGGLRDKLEFRHVRLVDDRVTFWTDGWEVKREAGEITCASGQGNAVHLPGACEVLEVNGIRCVLRREGRLTSVFRTGRVSPSGVAEPRLKLTSATDDVRLDRATAADADGSGYDAQLGVTVLKAPAAHFRITLAPAGTDPADQPALELRGLPPGPLTILWDGRLLTSFVRLANGTALVQLAGEVRAPTTLEVSVRKEAGK
jgi:hypothetical protein